MAPEDRRLLAGLFMVLTILAGCDTDPEPRTVLPDFLTQRFQEAPDKALADLRGRVFRIRSRVLVAGRSQIVLEGGTRSGRRLPSLICSLDEEQEETAVKIGKGALVTITGTVGAFDAGLSSVRLVDCQLER